MNKKQIKDLEALKMEYMNEDLSKENLSEKERHKISHQYRMVDKKRNPMSHLKPKNKKRKK